MSNTNDKYKELSRSNWRKVSGLNKKTVKKPKEENADDATGLTLNNRVRESLLRTFNTMPGSLPNPVDVLKKLPLSDTSPETVIQNAKLGILPERTELRRLLESQQSHKLGELRQSEGIESSPVLKTELKDRPNIILNTQDLTGVSPSYLPEQLRKNISESGKLVEDQANELARQRVPFTYRNNFEKGLVPQQLEELARQEQAKENLPSLKEAYEKFFNGDIIGAQKTGLNVLNERRKEVFTGALNIPKGLYNSFTYLLDPKQPVYYNPLLNSLGKILGEKTTNKISNALQRSREIAEEIVNSFGPDYNRYKRDRISDYTTGFGSTLGFLIGTYISRGMNLQPEIAAGLIGAFSQAGDNAYETYKKTGDSDKAYLSFIAGLPIGYSEKFGLGRLAGNIDILTKGEIKRVIAEGFREGTEETLQEGFQSFSGSAIDNLITGSNRDPFREAFENIQVAAPLGFIFPFGTAALGKIGGPLFNLAKEQYEGFKQQYQKVNIPSIDEMNEKVKQPGENAESIQPGFPKGTGTVRGEFENKINVNRGYLANRFNYPGEKFKPEDGTQKQVTPTEKKEPKQPEIKPDELAELESGLDEYLKEVDTIQQKKDTSNKIIDIVKKRTEQKNKLKLDDKKRKFKEQIEPKLNKWLKDSKSQKDFIDRIQREYFVGGTNTGEKIGEYLVDLGYVRDYANNENVFLPYRQYYETFKQKVDSENEIPDREKYISGIKITETDKKNAKKFAEIKRHINLNLNSVNTEYNFLPGESKKAINDVMNDRFDTPEAKMLVAKMNEALKTGIKNNPERGELANFMSGEELSELITGVKVEGKSEKAEVKKEEAAADEKEYFQWMANKEGGQKEGNQTTIKPLTEKLFNSFSIGGKLEKPLNYAEYKKAYPENTHIATVKIGGGKTIFDGIGSPEELRPQSKWALKVDSFESPEAKEHGSKFDSEEETKKEDKKTNKKTAEVIKAENGRFRVKVGKNAWINGGAGIAGGGTWAEYDTFDKAIKEAERLGYEVTNKQDEQPKTKIGEITKESEGRIQIVKPVNEKIEKVDEEILALGKKLLDLTKGSLSSGINPEALLVSTQLIGKYIEKSVYKFQDMLEDIMAKFGKDNFNKLFNALKTGYNAYKTAAEDDIAEQMDDYDYVKKFRQEWIEEGKSETETDKKAEIKTEEEKPYELTKKDKEYLDKMLPTVIEDLKSGRDFNSTLASIKSGILVNEFPAYKQYFIDKGIINEDSEYINKEEQNETDTEIKVIESETKDIESSAESAKTDEEKQEVVKKVKKTGKKVDETLSMFDEPEPEKEKKEKFKNSEYPIAVNEYGKEFRIKLWAAHITSGWEWYGFKNDGDIWDGFVHGFEDEYGSFTLSELKEIRATIVTDPTELRELAPPVGWEWKENVSDETKKKQITKETESGTEKEKEPESNNEERQQPRVEFEQNKPINKLATSIKEILDNDESIKDNKQLTDLADDAFGGTIAQGKYNIQDAYNALETAVNMYISEKTGLFGRDVEPGKVLENLRELLKRIPTQRGRTDEKDKFQQFSTPPTLSYLVNYAANPTNKDTALEPSAGNGGLVPFMRPIVKNIFTNEIDAKRREMLELQGYKTSNVDGMFLDDMLDESIKPTLIVMNPPFSATGGISKNKTAYGFQHIEQALQRLEPGGRLVAIMGEGIGFHMVKSHDWWRGIVKKYNVRANISLKGEEYYKYGTSFDNQLVVIDKTGATPGATFDENISYIITEDANTIEEAIELLKEIRNDRKQQTESAGNKQNNLPKDSRNLPADERTGKPETRTGDGRNTSLQSDEDTGTSEGRKPDGSKTSKQPEGVRKPAGSKNDTDGSKPDGQNSGENVSGIKQPQAVKPKIDTGTNEDAKKRKEESSGKFVEYTPAKLKTGVKHPGKLVESASMSAVEPPDIKYTPSLDQSVIDEGKLSSAQLEAVIYAGQRHSIILPDGKRAGFFVGDGTGVGKGREVSGIIADNYNQGRRKVLWVSVNNDLLDDAGRDLTDVGVNLPLSQLNSHNVNENIQITKGVIFSSYATMRSGSKTDRTKTRLRQILEWKPDVIIFDEGHLMKNEDTKSAEIGNIIQNSLPEARVVYSSATGATTPQNMHYMQRLGLWGEKTPFTSFTDFMNRILEGGLGAMEMIARDLKAMGAYFSRSLSYEGVQYKETKHILTDEQREIYDKAAKLWQVVLQDINAALRATNSDRGSTQKRFAMQRFWGDHQRFFNQVITAFKVPTAIKQAKQYLADNKSVVISLINTGEARTTAKALEALSEGKDLDDIDFSPREVLYNYVEAAFPVVQHRDVTNPETGKTTQVAMVDENGNPVLSREAMRMRQQLLDTIQDINLPENPLDQMVNEFGYENTAELTGRKKRLIIGKDGKKKYVPRNPKDVAMSKVNDWETQQFQDGKKRVAIISSAASTGISLHSDLRAKNQQQRVMITLQLGWSADKQIQTFGRVHRSNQVEPPIFDLLSTDLGGEVRFSSTMAKRLDSLGAITKGQRDTSGGDSVAKYNIDGHYGQTALIYTYNQILRSRTDNSIIVPGISSPYELLKKMGIIRKVKGGVDGIPDDILRDIPTFLNRVLSLVYDEQNAIFDYYMSNFADIIEAAKESGTFDEGVSDLKAERIVLKKEPSTVNTDEISGAKTYHYELEVYEKTNPITWDMVNSMYKSTENSFKRRSSTKQHGFFMNKKSKHVYYIMEVEGKTDATTGAVNRRFKRFSVNADEKYLIAAELQAYGKLEPETSISESIWLDNELKKKIGSENLDKTVKNFWEEQLSNVPETRVHNKHIIGGLVMPIYDKVIIRHEDEDGRSDTGYKVIRVTSEDGRRIVGLDIPQTLVGRVLANLSIGNNAATPEDIFNSVFNQGMEIPLTRGLSFKKTRLHNDDAFEIRNVPSELFDTLRKFGAFSERIDYKQRFFIPTDETEAIRIIGKVIEQFPLRNIQEQKDAQNNYIKLQELKALKDKLLKNRDKTTDLGVLNKKQQQIDDINREIIDIENAIASIKPDMVDKDQLPMFDLDNGKNGLISRINEAINKWDEAEYADQELIEKTLEALELEETAGINGAYELEADIKDYFRAVEEDFEEDGGRGDSGDIAEELVEKIRKFADKNKLKFNINNEVERILSNKAAAEDELKAVIKMLQKSFPDVNVNLVSNNIVKQYLRDNYGMKFENIKTPRGFYDNNSVYINKDKARISTPIHEFGHIWGEWCRKTYPGLWNEGIKIIKNATEFIEQVKAMGYGHLQGDDLYDEVLAQAIGIQGQALILSSEAETNRFKAWLNRLWEKIKSALGLNKSFDFNNATLDNFAEAIAKGLLQGRKEVFNARLEAAADELGILPGGTARMQKGFAEEMKQIVLKSIQEKGYYHPINPKSPVARAAGVMQRAGILDYDRNTRNYTLAKTNKITDTPAFKKWFGKSKVVDEQGNPMVVYHYTQINTDFNSFKKGRDDIGMHFGTSEQANIRGNTLLENSDFDITQNDPDNPYFTDDQGYSLYPRVLPVYLSIQNPLELKDNGEWTVAEIMLQLDKIPEFRRVFDEVDLDRIDYKELKTMLRKHGYDGIKYLNSYESEKRVILENKLKELKKELYAHSGVDIPEVGTKGWKIFGEYNKVKTELYNLKTKPKKAGMKYSWIALDPKQIKSATGNRGTFDPKNPDIRMQVDAWHGSATEFDRFSTRHIGTGEGSAGFGWGLYFTDKEEIARYYANKLAAVEFKDLNMQKVHEKANELIDEYPVKNPERLISAALISARRYAFLNSTKEGNEKAIELLKQDIQNIRKNSAAGIKTEMKLALEILNNSKGLIPNKNLYKVTLHQGKNFNDYDLIDWFKPLTAGQLKKVENQMKKEPDYFDTMYDYQNYKNETWYNADMHSMVSDYDRTDRERILRSRNGYELYKNLERVIHSEKATSMFLLRSGIDGIKYPASSFGYADIKGTNYVIFDEKAVTINERIKFDKDTTPGINEKAAVITDDKFNALFEKLGRIGAKVLIDNSEMEEKEFGDTVNRIFSNSLKTPFKLNAEQTARLFKKSRVEAGIAVRNAVKEAKEPVKQAEPSKSTDTAKEKPSEVKERSFPQQVLESRDVSKEIKGGLRNLQYGTISNQRSVNEANEYIEKHGIEKAARDAMNRKSELPDRLRVTMSEVIIKLLSDEGDTLREVGRYEEAGDKYDLAIDVAEAVGEKGTELGQAVQAFNIFNRLTPQGALYYAQKITNNINKKTAKQIREKIKLLKEIIRTANDETIQKVLKDLQGFIKLAIQRSGLTVETGKPGAVNQPKNKTGKPGEKKQKNKEAEQILAARIAAAVKSKEKKTDPVREMVNTLFDIAKENELIPAKAPKTLENLLGVISNAIKAEDKYREVWEKAKTIVHKRFSEDPAALNTLSEYFDYFLEHPFSEGQMERVVKKGLKELEIEIGEIVKKHYTVSDEAKKQLSEKLIELSGLDKEYADKLTEAIKKKFDELATERKRKLIESRVKAPLEIGKKSRAFYERIIEDSNLGMLSTAELREAFAARFKMKKITPDQAQKITEMANEIQLLPDKSLQQHRKIIDMLTYIRTMNGISIKELIENIFYANILSGITTHAKNTLYNFLNTAVEIIPANMYKPMDIPFMLMGLLKGYGSRGFAEAWSMLIEGYGQGDPKYVRQRFNWMDQYKFKGGKINPLNYLKYVTRALQASDRFFNYGLREAKYHALAYRISKEKGLKGKKLTAEMMNILNYSADRIEAARLQAENEGLKGLDVSRRMNEILEQNRPVEMQEAAEKFAARGTLTNQPRGVLGNVVRSIKRFEEVPVAGPFFKFVFMPFSNIVANVFNNNLDFTPIGYKRAFFGYQGEEGMKGDEFWEEMGRATFGMITLTALIFLTFADDDDDEGFTITATGHSDFKKNEQLRETGWREYSFRWNGKWWNYLNTPLVVPFALVGHMKDYIKYRKKDPDAEYWDLISTAILLTGNSILDMSFLSGMATLFDVFGDDDVEKKERFLINTFAGTGTSFIVPNIVKQLALMFDDTNYVANTLPEKILKNIGIAEDLAGMKPRLNVLGEPIKRDGLLQKVIGGSKDKNDPVWEFIINNSSYISVPSKNTIIFDPSMQQERTLTPEEYYNYVDISGKLIKKGVSENLEFLKLLNPEEARDIVKTITDTARKMAREEITGLKHTGSKEMFDYDRLVNSIKSGIDRSIDKNDYESIEVNRQILQKMTESSTVPKDTRKKARELYSSYDKYIDYRREVDVLNDIFEDTGVKKTSGQRYSYTLKDEEKKNLKIDKERVLELLDNRLEKIDDEDKFTETERKQQKKAISEAIKRIRKELK